MSKTKNAATTRTISIPSETVLAEVTAFPDEVMVSVEARDGILTTQQARDLATTLIEAADESERIDWDMETDPNTPRIVDRVND